MLPSVLFHWRGTLVAVVAYIILDQIVGWTTWQAAMPIPLASPWGLLGYLRPLLVASMWPLGVELWRWRAERIVPRMPSHGGLARPSAPPPNSLVRNVDSAPLARRGEAGVAEIGRASCRE